jgi:hypothetical protein
MGDPHARAVLVACRAHLRDRGPALCTNQVNLVVGRRPGQSNLLIGLVRDHVLAKRVAVRIESHLALHRCLHVLGMHHRSENTTTMPAACHTVEDVRESTDRIATTTHTTM